jgi:RNA polymerase sigma-70 factor (ECF subfamily)
VFRAAYRVTGNASDAEDVLQTVFLRLMRRPAGEPGPDNMESYLHRAAVNAALDIIRSRASSTLPLATDNLPSDPSPSPERRQAAQEIRSWLRRAVAALHPTAAEMFALRYFEELDNSEVARRLGTTDRTVAVTLHRARERLRTELGEYLGSV